MENQNDCIGFSIYHSGLKGWLSNDDYFADKIALAQVFQNETFAKTKIKKMCELYKNVSAYKEEFMSIKKVYIKEAEPA